MLARIHSFVLTGVDAHPCEIEVDLAESGIAREQIVGLPDAAVRESVERVRSAVGNTGYVFPNGRLLVNLAPADVRKEGPVYDLPIALGLLAATGAVRHTRPARQLATVGAGGPPEQEESGGGGLDHRRFLFAGELALDGRLRPIRGAIAMAMLARAEGFDGVVVPVENADEASVVEGIETYGVRTLAEVVGLLNGTLHIEPQPAVDVAGLLLQATAPVDFAEVKGQEGVKRAITIAAAGGHNLLMLGPPGTGKTMMARALPGVLPPMSPAEALEVTRIYSSAGKLAPHQNGEGHSGLMTLRPVRAPHHTASSPALIGGGSIPRPGEVSLAHHGVLFLDELPEFARPILETLRQPLEDEEVSIARAHSSVRFPARFMLVAAMNPTPKGEMPDDAASRREMDRYLSRISGPLIDRIDIHVEAPAVPWRELSEKGTPGTSTAEMRSRVLAARRIQWKRQGEVVNARMRGDILDECAQMSEQAKGLIGQALSDLGLSARAYDKIRRVARTIADLNESEGIDTAHAAEAIQYRLLDRRA